MPCWKVCSDHDDIVTLKRKLDQTLTQSPGSFMVEILSEHLKASTTQGQGDHEGQTITLIVLYPHVIFPLVRSEWSCNLYCIK